MNNVGISEKKTAPNRELEACTSFFWFNKIFFKVRTIHSGQFLSLCNSDVVYFPTNCTRRLVALQSSTA